MKFITAALCVLLTSCATVMSGGGDDGVRVVSDPPGAVVRRNGQAVGVTPMNVRVGRKYPVPLAVELPGCGILPLNLQRVGNGWRWGNLMFGAFAPATAAVDYLTGAWYKIRQEQVGGRCINGQAVPFEAIVLGMTSTQVLQAWGAPQSINRTVTPTGSDEQWVYGFNSYVYLTNGIVRAVQSTEIVGR